MGNPLENLSISFAFWKFGGDISVANPQSLGTGRVLQHKGSHNKVQVTGKKH